MNDKEFLKEVIERGSKADDGYFQFAHIVAVLLPKNLHEQLAQLVGNPTWDGDVLAKSLRDELFYYGLAIRVCINGEQGYTGATYFAFSVLKVINEIKSGRIGA